MGVPHQLDFLTRALEAQFPSDPGFSFGSRSSSESDEGDSESSDEGSDTMSVASDGDVDDPNDDGSIDDISWPADLKEASISLPADLKEAKRALWARERIRKPSLRGVIKATSFSDRVDNSGCHIEYDHVSTLGRARCNEHEGSV